MTTEHTTERNDQRRLSRRSVLVLGAAGASTVALAACSKAKSTENTPSSAGSTTSAAGSTSTSASTSPSTSALGGSSSGGAHALAELADLPIGGAISAKDAGGSDIIKVSARAWWPASSQLAPLLARRLARSSLA